MNATVRRVTTPAGDPAWYVGDYATARRLLTDPRLGRSHPDPANAPRYTDSLIFGRAVADGSVTRTYFAAVRTVLNRSLAAGHLAALQPRVQQITDGLLTSLASLRQPADFHEAVSFPLPALVICELLGIPAEDRDEFRRWSEMAADKTDASRSHAGLAALWAYGRDVLARKRDEPADDVLSALAAFHARGSGGSSPDEAAHVVAGLIFAGHETTVSAIDKGVLLLLDQPGDREALAEGTAHAGEIVEEILRLPLPVHDAGTATPGGLPRYACADVEVNGTVIRAGELVLLDLQAANLDGWAFPEPEVFNGARAGCPHLAFGFGQHYCIGAPLARLELRTLFVTLFRRFPDLRLACAPDELRVNRQRLAGGLTALPVRW